MRKIDPLSVLANSDGNIERIMPGDSWMVPSEVWICGDRLYYSRGNFKDFQVRPSKGMFEGFLRLHKSGVLDEEIAAYARKWGVINICQEHEMPVSHSRSHFAQPPAGCCPLGYYGDPERGGSRDTYEPLAAWRMFSRQAFALISIASNLARGNPGDAADWQVAYSVNPKGGHSPNSFESGRHFLADIVNDWLLLAAVRPVFEWHHDSSLPSLTFGSGGLLGAIALQLCLTTSRSNDFSLCAHCKSPFMKNIRSAKRGQRSFCQDCRRENMPQRYSARDSHDRKKRTRS